MLSLLKLYILIAFIDQLVDVGRDHPAEDLVHVVTADDANVQPVAVEGSSRLKSIFSQQLNQF